MYYYFLKAQLMELKIYVCKSNRQSVLKSECSPKPHADVISIFANQNLNANLQENGSRVRKREIQ